MLYEMSEPCGCSCVTAIWYVHKVKQFRKSLCRQQSKKSFHAFQSKVSISSSVGFFIKISWNDTVVGEIGGRYENFCFPFSSLLYLLLGFVIAEWYLRFKDSQFSSVSLVYTSGFFLLPSEKSY